VYVKNVLDASGCIGASLVLSGRGVCAPGACTLGYNLEVLNCFRRLRVRMVLEQRAQLLESPSRLVTHVIYERYLGEIRAVNAYRRWVGEQVWMPDTRRIAVHIAQRYADRRIVVLGYYLVVRIEQLFGKPLIHIETPIVVSERQFLPGRRPNATIDSGAATI
jgi:hypothetical protein